MFSESIFDLQTDSDLALRSRLQFDQADESVLVGSKILVIGGAGYIGSHMVKELIRRGDHPVVFDNLSSGHADAVIGCELVIGDLSSPDEIRDVLTQMHFDGVIHFASSIEVGESVLNPRKYYSNNVSNSFALLNAMLDQGVNNLIFSSSAAVYGSPAGIPIQESHPCAPLNPYGKSKRMVEWALEDYRSAYGFSSTSLRYFNAAGADPDGKLGERHEPESPLIPLVIQAALGLRPSVSIYGTDYETPDGTCIRDYVHVSDLCDAHALAMDKLLQGESGGVFNLGNGKGFSVKEVIDEVRRVSGVDFSIQKAGRRPGDPAMLVADAGLARRSLGWQPKRDRLDVIVADAWRFFERHAA